MAPSSTPQTRLMRPIAVVGAGALFPGSGDARGFWHDVLAGKDLITEVPRTHWLAEDYYDPDPAAVDKIYAKRGAFLQAMEFNPLEFAIPPANLSSTDTAQLLALLVAKQVLEDAAGGPFATLDRSRTSVVLGVASATELVTQLSARMQRPVWAHALRQHGFDAAQVEAICDRISSLYVPWTENSFPGMLGNVVAGRIANRFDLAGTNCVIDAACASSLGALHLALMELECGHSDLVITGGVDALNDVLMYTCFSKTPALSPTGDCRPFSAAADGTILGEGIGMLALKRLADAERDQDRIYAVIRGLGTSSDGLSKSIYAPVAEGQAKALRRTYEVAGYGPETVEMLEAHGTGTRAGDLAEFQGLGRVFGASSHPRKRWCALGSVKSQIGHTKAAAGSAGLFKAVMALHHKVLPPTIKIDEPNPALDLDNSAFYLNTAARPWIRGADHPRRASVSSFGFGGSNYHVTLEEYTGAAPRRPRLRTLDTELLLVAAESAAQLADKCRAMDLSAQAFAHTAHQSLQNWQGGTHRLALVVTADTAATALAQALERIERAPGQPFALPGGAVHYGVGPAAGALALLFSGQGSQYVDMGRDLAMHFDVARAVWDRAADMALDTAALHEVVFPAPAFSDDARARQLQTLTATQWAQPAIAAVQLSQLAVLRQVGITPQAVAGHSFGEFTALAAAGSLSADDLLRVARRRGELMAQATAVPGAMTAVMGGPADLETQIQAAGLGVIAANRNAPTQTVFSGELAQIERFESWLTERNLEFRRLPVSTAFHSPLVMPAVEPLQQFLSGVEIRPASVPVYANTTAQPYPADPHAIRRQLATQLAEPVRFSEQITRMHEAGVRIFLEVGPRSPLSSFVEQTLAGQPCLVVSLDRQGSDGLVSLCQALAKLAAAGVPLQPARLWQEYAAPLDPSERKKAPLSVRIQGSNYGRLYPPANGSEQPVAAAAETAASSHPSPTRNAAEVEQAAELEMQQWMAQLQSDYQARQASSGTATSSEAFVHTASPAAVIPPTTVGATRGPGTDALREVLLQVVSDKTGYPTDMLDLSLELEAGLGIDSIKRVEILSAFRDRVPGLPEVAPSQLAALNTLGEVLAYMQQGAPAPAAAAVLANPAQTIPTTHTAGSTPASAQPSAPSPALPSLAPAALATPATPAAPSADVLREVLLQVVSDKTGYPTDMLDLSLELEAGLGIDSIKRVEILSAFRDRVPGLPEVAPSQLAALNTLGEVLAYMQQGAPAPAAAAVLANPAQTIPTTHTAGSTPASAQPSAPSPALPSLASAALATPATPAAPSADVLREVLLQVVSDKTGYPTDMLDLSLELEAGLGIDSIKRVEILSAFRDRVPGLPEVAPSQLAALNTLGEVLAYMQQGAPAATTPGASRPTGASFPSAGPASPTGATAPLPRHAVRAVAQAAAGLAMPGLLQPGALIGVTDDGTGVAHLLVKALQAQGVGARVVAGPSACAGCTGLIVLAGLQAVASAPEAIRINRQGFEWVHAMAHRLSERDGLLVTVQDTGGDFGLSGHAGVRAYLGGLAALARTAANEWPQAAVKAIDIEAGGRAPAALAKAIAAELFQGGPEREVGLPARAPRLTLTTQPTEAPTGSCVIDGSSVVLATGGARGVTAVCLQALATRKPRIAILGRTPLEEEPADLRDAHTDADLKRLLLARETAQGRKPSPVQLSHMTQAVQAAREVRSNLQAMQQAGAEVLYCVADVADEASVRRALDHVRAQWGPITGLVHGAGVVADKLIKDKTLEQYDSVFSTKVEGLRILLDALAADPLQALIMFSSVAARVGNPGQSDYAMANEVLNQVALVEAQRRPGCLVRAIGWGPWDGGMVTPALRAHFDAQGVSLIPPGRGAAACLAELHLGASPIQLVVGTGEPRDLLARDTGHRGVVSAEIVLDPQRHEFLRSHCIGADPVVPVVLVVEWFVRAAMALVPGAGLPALSDLRVLRGIVLADWGRQPQRLRLTARFDPGAGRRLRCEVHSIDGAVTHYAASADFGTPSNTQTQQPRQPQQTRTLRVGDVSRDTLYASPALFHGPDLQAIRRLSAEAGGTVRAELYGRWALGWQNDDLLLDIAALDGGLQVALGALFETEGACMLPTRLGAVQLKQDPANDGPIRCTLNLRASDPLRAVCDIAITGGGWSVSMTDVEVHARAAAPAATTQS